MGFRSDQVKTLGPELAAVLPQDNIPWYKKKSLVQLNLSVFSLFLFSGANGYDGSMMNGLQALPQWHDFMDHPTGAWLGFVNGVQSLGAFCAYPFVAKCNNAIGRKKTIAIGYFWLLLGAGLQAGAINPTMFVIGRFCIGGTSAFYAGAVPVLMTEIAYPSHRSPITALYNCGWYVGSLLAAWATYGTRDYDTSWAWRIPSVLQIAIPMVAVFGFLAAPESPRWYISKNKTEQARSVLVKYHGEGDENSPLAAFELEQISQTLQQESQYAAETSYLGMVRGKPNRHRTFISVTLGVFAQWNGVGIASYYLAPVLNTVGVTEVGDQTMISGFLQLWNLILSVGAAFSVDRLGRRPLFLASCVGMLISYICITAFAGSFDSTGRASLGIAVVPFLFIYYGFYDIAFTPLLFSYTCEIWPYNYRARGLAVSQISTQLAIFFNVFVNPIALEAIAWRYYAVYAGLLVIITVTIYFCYPETKGHSLEEMASIFEGKKATVTHETVDCNAVDASTKSDEAGHASSIEGHHVEKSV